MQDSLKLFSLPGAAHKVYYTLTISVIRFYVCGFVGLLTLFIPASETTDFYFGGGDFDHYIFASREAQNARKWKPLHTQK